MDFWDWFYVSLTSYLVGYFVCSAIFHGRRVACLDRACNDDERVACSFTHSPIVGAALWPFMILALPVLILRGPYLEFSEVATTRSLYRQKQNGLAEIENQ